MTKQIQTKTWESVRKTARRILPAFGALTLGVVSILPTANVWAESTAWGPERNTYTWESPAPHVTFNSITNEGGGNGIGDERNFVRVRKAGSGDKYADYVNAEVGQEYEIYVFFHNNASESLNASGAGIAQNVRLKMEIPEHVQDGKYAMIKGTISVTNADPTSVWDTAYIKAPDNQSIYLRYVDNSAVIHVKDVPGTVNGEILSETALFNKDGNGGAFLGYYQNQWGLVPGCNQFAGYVTLRVKVDQPGFRMEKTASVDQGQTWGDSVTVKPGDSIDFRISYQNTGTTLAKDVTAYDNLPDGMELISGSTFLKTPTTEGFETDDKLFVTGMIIGDYLAGQDASVSYSVKIDDDEEKFPCGTTKIYNNSAIRIGDDVIHDKVEVNVFRECIDTPEDLPETGPASIVMTLLMITWAGVGVAYYAASRKELSKLEANISNEE